jgi:hypothetical protein
MTPFVVNGNGRLVLPTSAPTWTSRFSRRSPKTTTGGVLDGTGGTEIVGVVGAILVGVALFQG